MNIRKVTAFWSLSLLLAFASAVVQAQESGWPRSLPLEDGSITIYPLQVDAMDGDLLRYRAALAYKKAGDPDPVFGAGWFESHVEIDREEGVVHPLDLTVVDTRFPDGTDEVQPELAFVIAQQAPNWNLDFPLPDLLSALETAKLEAKTAQNLNTAPPTILYRDHSALLVTIDGDPVLRAIENSHYQAVINTPYPLIFDGRVYYLGAAKGAWYRADRATGPYRYDASPPADIVAMVDAAADEEANPASTERVTAANAPEIIVATTPTELIVTEGPAAFVPLVDDLLVLSNSADDVFMHISSQQFYIVLAGRWYQSASLNGPWSYRAADDLPTAFASIPQNSDQADTRVYVAGTAEARDAVLDAQVPQPATVARGPVDLDVNYDGEPRFEPVEGTDDLAYADNSDSTVLQEDHEYYLVEDGVWYVSSSPDGPWAVSDYRPAGVASISPRSPVYNVKYVYIYDSTPEVVYVGYTPGYIGSYIYHDTIVYGTGWYYRPWISPRYYYPRYSTWGFNVDYNPWYGWSFGLSWGWGPFYAGYYSGGFWHHNRPWHRPRGGYWGPAGYRPRPAHYAHHRGGNRGYGRDDHGRDRSRRGDYDRGYYGRDDYDRDRNGRSGRGRNGRGQDSPDYGRANTYVRNQNLYHDRAQRARVTETRDFRENRNREPERGLAANRRAPAMRDSNPVRRDRAATRPSKAGRNRTGPVRPSDLRVKAQIRDASREAEVGRLIADNSGYVRRRAQAPVESNGWQSAAAGEVRRARAPARDVGRTGAGKQTGRAGDYAKPLEPQRPTPFAGTRQSRNTSRAATRASEPQPADTRRTVQQRNTATRNTTSARSAQRTDLQRFAQARGASPGNRTRTREQQSAAQPRYIPQQAVTRPGAREARASRSRTPLRSSLPSSAPPSITRQRSTPSRPVQQRSVPSRPVQQRSVPSRTVQQRSVPSRPVQQRSVPSRTVQQRSVPSRPVQQRSTPTSRAPQRSTRSSSPPAADYRKQSSPAKASSQKTGRTNGGQRNGGKARRRG